MELPFTIIMLLCKKRCCIWKKWRKELREETNQNAKKGLNDLKFYLELNLYSAALDYCDNNRILFIGEFLDKELEKEYESLYEEIVYGTFFIEYKEVTNDAKAFYESPIGTEYLDYYYKIDEELLAKEFQTQLESKVSVAANSISIYIQERDRLARQKNAKLYIGLSESLVRKELGSPNQIEVDNGYIPEDRRTAKESWYYYTYDGELSSYFVIGLNGRVLDAYQYR